MAVSIEREVCLIVCEALTPEQVYVRLGIRVLYKGAKGRMEGARGKQC